MSKILIVDDNRMMLHALSEYLEKMGYDIEVAASGLDALDYLENEVPDLIIMDIVMPGMDGVETTRKIREDPRIKDVPVVAFTSQSNQGQWEGLFDDYLVKPFDYDGLRVVIERFLAGV